MIGDFRSSVLTSSTNAHYKYKTLNCNLVECFILAKKKKRYTWLMYYRIGVDEVGRGPIAGPIVVCACAVTSTFDILSLFPKGALKDSKKLSEKVRNEIVSKIEVLVSEGQIIYGLGEVSAHDIDTHGLSKAIKDATRSALGVSEAAGVSKESSLFLDGVLHADESYINQETIIKGDEKVGEIALASIIAKVYRDNLMKKVASKHPEYGFEKHVGYGTKAHYEALKEHGLTTYHRRSFLKGMV